MRPGETRHSIASIASIAPSLPRRRGGASLACKPRRGAAMSDADEKGPDMRFSYNQVWEDTLRLLRENAALLAAIAGVFLFLPALLVAVLVPPPVPPQGG